ncbi:hypothetical protein F4777DRAFT_31352 [Nemania sp. FL0916]|nr:hypothetical protein F4777DRAFT_31352 [Nemania sp. FL0916]
MADKPPEPPKPPALLPAFGEDKFFEEAFNYDRDKIVAWLKACAKGDKGGARTQVPEVKILLIEIGTRLETLILPDGVHLRKKELKPDSHFARQIDPKWKSRKETPRESKFKVFPLPSTFQGGLTTAIAVGWFNPYDLLGLFLSVLGPAAVGATKKTFFLPLCAVYARWCSRIAGHADDEWEWDPPGAGEGIWPRMFNITWRPEGTPETGIHFFLGSSTAGDKWDMEETGQWKRRVQRQRFDVLHSALQLKPFNADSFDKRKSPVQDRFKGGGWAYGNCAETYPFIFSVRGTVDANKNLQGLALQKEFMQDPNLKIYDPSILGAPWRNLRGPCENCSAIITNAGADLKNFARDYEEAKQEEPEDKPQTTSQVIEAMGEPTAVPDATAATSAPNGFTDNPEYLDTSHYWGTKGAGTLAAKKVGLTNPQGLFIVVPERGGDRYIFKDNTTGKIYLWSMLTDEIFEFTKPTDLAGIVAQLNLPVEKSTLETTQLDDV